MLATVTTSQKARVLATITTSRRARMLATIPTSQRVRMLATITTSQRARVLCQPTTWAKCIWLKTSSPVFTCSNQFETSVDLQPRYRSIVTFGFYAINLPKYSSTVELFLEISYYML